MSEQVPKGSCPARVLVATDASPSSAAAERAAIELSSRVGASLILLNVIDPSRLKLPGGLFHTRVDQVRAERQQALARIVESARQSGVATQYLIWLGDPGASVLEAAEAESADVIVIGSHARGLVGHLLLGSVSSFVVGHGRWPVVVVRPGQSLDDVWLPCRPVVTAAWPSSLVGLERPTRQRSVGAGLSEIVMDLHEGGVTPVPGRPTPVPSGTRGPRAAHRMRR